MPNNYKLCPNCNNALDLNVNKCPYCGQQTFGLDLSNGKDGFVKVIENLDKSKNKKQTSGCTIIIEILIIVTIISLISRMISILF